MKQFQKLHLKGNKTNIISYQVLLKRFILAMHLVKENYLISLQVENFFGRFGDDLFAHKGDPRAEISGEIVRYDTLAPRPEFCCLCVLFAHAEAPSYCVLFAPAQGPSNSGSYYIEENEMNCEGSSEYMIMFMSFTRASFLTYGRISHLIG